MAWPSKGKVFLLLLLLLNNGVITLYPPVAYLKFNLPICGFIFDTLPTRGSIRYYSVIHLPICHYSNTFSFKIKTQNRSNSPLPQNKLSSMFAHPPESLNATMLPIWFIRPKIIWVLIKTGSKQTLRWVSIWSALCFDFERKRVRVMADREVDYRVVTDWTTGG